MVKLCPSAQPGMEHCRVLGVVQRDGPTPMLQYLDQHLPATAEVLDMAAPLKPTEVFRLAATCAETQMPALRRDGLPVGNADRANSAANRGYSAPVHHTPGMPLVFSGRQSGLSALPRDYDRELRYVAHRTAGFRVTCNAGLLAHKRTLRPRAPADQTGFRSPECEAKLFMHLYSFLAP